MSLKATNNAPISIITNDEVPENYQSLFDEIIEMDFANNSNYQQIILNGFADFRDTLKEDFIIGEDSDAINKAKSTLFNFDILGTDRTANPAIGAYQNITFD